MRCASTTFTTSPASTWRSANRPSPGAPSTTTLAFSASLFHSLIIFVPLFVLINSFIVNHTGTAHTGGKDKRREKMKESQRITTPSTGRRCEPRCSAIITVGLPCRCSAISRVVNAFRAIGKDWPPWPYLYHRSKQSTTIKTNAAIKYVIVNTWTRCAVQAHSVFKCSHAYSF